MSLSGSRAVISDLELMNWNHFGLDMGCNLCDRDHYAICF
jgi:hypothetical protein